MDEHSGARRVPPWVVCVVAGCALIQLAVALGAHHLLLPRHASPPRSVAQEGAAPGQAPGQGAPETGDGDLRRAPITALLDQRAAALRAHDRARFVATVDPRQQAFRQAQGSGFDNATPVPFASWEYRLATLDAFPLSEQRRRELGGSVLAAHVQLYYRIDQADPVPAVLDQYLVFARLGTAWYLASDSDGTAAGHRATVALWDLGRVTVLRRPGVLLLGLGEPAALAHYADEVERARPDVTRVWGTDWAHPVVVLVPERQTQMAALLGAAPEQYARIAAVTTGDRGVATESVPADRVIVNPDAFDRLGALGRHVVITHELTHVASRTLTPGWTPTWLSEGFADYTAYLGAGQSVPTAAPELVADVHAGRLPVALPDEARFATTRPDLPQAYEMAWLACRMIAERWGQDHLVALYRAVGAAPTRGAPTPDPALALRSALTTVLGVDTAEFTRRWIHYVAEQAG